MRKPTYSCAYALVALSLLGVMGCYSSIDVGDSSDEKAIAIDWVDPPCAEPGSEAGYIEGTGFGAENVTITVGGIEAEVLTATGKDASFVVPLGLPPGPIEVVVENPGGRLATIGWSVCEVECDPVDCDDGNECTTDTCDTSDGTCTNDPVADGTSCDFGGVDGVCEAGECVKERSWGTAVQISTLYASRPQVAVDPNGNATVVWFSFPSSTDENIWSNRYTPSGGWGADVLIQTDNGFIATDPQVAVDPNGNATAVWRQAEGSSDNIWSNRYTPSGGWGAAVLIETEDTGGASQPQVAVDPSGNATAVWSQQVGIIRVDIWSNRYTPSGGWGAAVLIETDDAGSARDPQVAVDPSGNATAVWSQHDGVRNNVWSNRYTPSGGWGTAVLIETDDAGNAGGPQVAVDPSGNATAVWSQHDGVRNNVWSNRYTPSGGWGAAVLIATAAGAPQVAVDPSGNATVVFSGGGGIWSNRYTPSGGWGAAVLIATAAGLPQVAVDPSGNATVVWAQAGDIWSNRYTPSGGWGAAVLIETEDTPAGSPQVAVDASGNAVAVWYQSDGSIERTGYAWSNRFE